MIHLNVIVDFSDGPSEATDGVAMYDGASVDMIGYLFRNSCC